MGIPDHLTFPLETCMQVKKQQLEPCMEKLTAQDWDRSTIEQSVVTLFIYLTCMLNASWEMPGWMNCKLESK